MQNRIIVPISTSSIDTGSHQYIGPETLQEIATAALDNVGRLRGGVTQCVHLAVVTSEDVASAMIDHAIELSAQANAAIDRYGSAASQWDGLISLGEAKRMADTVRGCKKRA